MDPIENKTRYPIVLNRHRVIDIERMLKVLVWTSIRKGYIISHQFTKNVICLLNPNNLIFSGDTLNWHSRSYVVPFKIILHNNSYSTHIFITVHSKIVPYKFSVRLMHSHNLSNLDQIYIILHWIFNLIRL